MAENNKYKIRISKSTLVQWVLFFFIFTVSAFAATHITDTYIDTPKLNVSNVVNATWVNSTKLNGTYYGDGRNLALQIGQTGNTTQETIDAVNITVRYDFTARNTTYVINTSYEYYLNDTLNELLGFNTTDETRNAVNVTLRYDFTARNTTYIVNTTYEYYLNDTLNELLGFNTTDEARNAVNITARYDFTARNTTYTVNTSYEYYLNDTLNTLLGFNTTAEVITAMNITTYFQIQARNATDLICSDCIGATEIDESNLVVQPSWGINSSAEMISAVNITSYYQLQARNATDLICTDCIGGTEIAELADADVSNTLTCSIMDLAAATFTNDIHWGNLSAWDLNVLWAGTLDGANITADSLSGTQIAELTDADISNTLTCSDLSAGSSVVADAEVDDDLTIVTDKWINTTQGMHLGDNNKTYYGEDDDATIEFNGTHLVITG